MVAEVGAIGIFHPRRQTGGLVVEEESAIAHGRFAVGIFAGEDIELGVALYGHIGPEVPGRDAYLARQLVDAVDSASLVAACDDELAVDGGDDILLGLTLQITQQSLFHPGVDLLVDSHGADGYFRGER